MNAKEKVVDYIKVFVYAILAGVCISMGGIAYLSCENVVVGALFFCVGLFIILNFNFNLFTGKVCYVFNNDWRYSIKVVIILLGNFVGANLLALCLKLTRLLTLQERCSQIVANKLSDGLLSLFVLGIFCNILIYVAVEGFKSENVLTKYLSLFFGVATFVICGFEHSVADMFYFAFAGEYSGQMFLALLVVILGNCVGGVFIELIKKLFEKKDKLHQ